jgi:predicted nucleic acid-binding protein
MSRISLDTNLLVYAVDTGAGDKHERAREVLRLAAQLDAVLTQQVVGEFLNVSRKMRHLNQRRLRRIAAGLCATFPIVATPKEALFDAFDRAARSGLQFWDSVIVTVCLENAVRLLISEDFQDGLVIDGLTVLNPFNPGNSDRLAGVLEQAPDRA